MPRPSSSESFSRYDLTRTHCAKLPTDLLYTGSALRFGQQRCSQPLGHPFKRCDRLGQCSQLVRKLPDWRPTWSYNLQKLLRWFGCGNEAKTGLEQNLDERNLVQKRNQY